MVKTVRLLAAVMEKEGMQFPLHLGVTEAGDGEDGRIKSALGIGALLADGLGDTIRVSLSEAPEAEIPVARKLVDYIMQHQDHPYIPGVEAEGFNYLSPVRRETTAVRNIGGNHLPVVIAERMDGKFDTNPQFIPDYIYAGRALPETREEGVEYILDADVWEEEPGTYPAFNYQQMPLMGNCQADLKFMFMPYMAQTEEVIACLKYHPEVVIISQSNHPNRLGEHRALVHQLMQEGLKNPVVFFQHYAYNICCRHGITYLRRSLRWYFPVQPGKSHSCRSRCHSLWYSASRTYTHQQNGIYLLPRMRTYPVRPSKYHSTCKSRYFTPERIENRYYGLHRQWSRRNG